jgi:hypothetical protein
LSPHATVAFESASRQDDGFGVDEKRFVLSLCKEGLESTGLRIEVDAACCGRVESLDAEFYCGGLVEVDEAFAAICSLQGEAAEEFEAVVDFVCLFWGSVIYGDGERIGQT